MTTYTPTGRAAIRVARACLVALVALLALLAGSCAPQRKSAEIGRPEAVEFYVRGEQARRAGDAAAAEREYRTAVQRNPNLRMAHSRLGDMYKARGDYAGASRHYESLARLHP